jgi:secreted trypsin-like serine protease
LHLRLTVALALALGCLTAGAATAAPSPRIIGGTEVADSSWNEQWRSVVSIGLSYEYRRHAHACTGVLIRRDVVLTARHCVADGRFEHDAAAIVVHPLRRIDGAQDRNGIRAVSLQLTPDAPSAYLNRGGDLAIVKLEREIDGQPIDIATLDDSAYWGGGSGRVEGAKIAGYGVHRDADLASERPFGGSSAVLREAAVPIYDDARCRRAAGKGVRIAQLLCAGQPSPPSPAADARQACYGDSGGPLVATDPGGIGPPKVIGIASLVTGTMCGAGLSIYTRVAGRRAWIDAAVTHVTGGSGIAPNSRGSIRQAEPTRSRRGGHDQRIRMLFSEPARAPESWVVQYQFEQREGGLSGWFTAARGIHGEVAFVTLPPGHQGQVLVRAFRVLGNGVRIDATSGRGPTSSVRVDARPPSRIARLTAVRHGFWHRLAWTPARDNDRVIGFMVEQRRHPGGRWMFDAYLECSECWTSPRARPETRSVHYLLAGRRQFRIAAIDRAGNFGPWAVSGVTAPGANA